MKVLINDREVGDEYTGCALCGDNRRTGTYLSIDGTLKCKTCGKPWSGTYQETAGSRLYFCCGDHYREFRKLIQRAITIGNMGRVRTVLISVSGGERSIRIEDYDGRVVMMNESIFNLTKQ
ncbi:TA0938 family protein [Vulcanisaeta souniana]|uniref:Uncharacterized protein n=1 Tax=Vulcanisaeta souniana JCM 11219 TaxID=1293586 RepID=A0A830EI68_9CREN|nr:TA0938 family protein [Vulcanisaeta souniana]BDR93067.1 hypothetical protein Vsou_21600 [Vulcanisaeta souniana JCM 11219]GGI87326.1 hypothetical protein GCM10007112_25310 [Vulcanisaeta souniana JCM 11219]